MDVPDYIRQIDAQMQKQAAEQASKRPDRRAKQVPVAVDRRSGQDRRKNNNQQ
jgi:hypothetical protein